MKSAPRVERIGSRFLVVAALASALCIQPTFAQKETVASRARPDFDAVGMRQGSFLVLPSVEIAETYNDNIFKEAVGEDTDFITSIKPEVKINSQWNNHALNFGAGLHADVYAADHDENTLDYFVEADGRVDVLRTTNLTASGSYRQLHEDRGNPNTASAAREPVEYSLTHFSLGAFHKLNRLNFTASANFDDYSYDNAVNATTGAAIVQNDRDRIHSDIGLRIGYELMPEYEAFVRGTLFNRSYDTLQGAALLDRDSDGYELVVGTDIELGRLLFGEVFVGYREQDYDAATLVTIDGPTFGLSLSWNVTPLTTIRPSVTRSVEETTIGGSSGYFATTFGIGADHELLRNLILSADASLSNSDYEGTGITREDDVLRFGIGGKYLVNRNLHASLNYEFETRDSNVAGSDYDRNTIELLVRLQF